tara:strand:+ start:79 stop:267 length:189 start_codon:yes stop_codon:yes gene_type:complete
MRNKSYIDDQLEKADALITNLINDIDNNRPYTTKEYILDRLLQIQNSTMLAKGRLGLENETD